MFEKLEKYTSKGHFFFRNGDKLKEVSKGVPNLPGIYYILRLSKGKIEIVYIGKSGTLKQDGTFKEQGLRKRINNQQEGVDRETFFNTKLQEEQIEALDIYWFVTVEKDKIDIPGFIEGQIIQEYFNIYSMLPDWNKEY